jgi:type II secretory pathway pseudopilin PulG
MPLQAVTPQQNADGFSLIETLIGLSLAAFGLLAIGQLLLASTSSECLARSKESAVLAARNKLNYLSHLYLVNSAHEDLAAGTHGPEEVCVVNPNDGSTLELFRIQWSTSCLADPRPGKALFATKLQVAATPIRTDGSFIDSPYFKRTVHLTAILTP